MSWSRTRRRSHTCAVFRSVLTTSFVPSGLKASGVGAIGWTVDSRASSRPVAASASDDLVVERHGHESAVAGEMPCETRSCSCIEPPLEFPCPEPTELICGRAGIRNGARNQPPAVGTETDEELGDASGILGSEDALEPARRRSQTVTPGVYHPPAAAQ